MNFLDDKSRQGHCYWRKLLYKYKIKFFFKCKIKTIDRSCHYKRKIIKHESDWAAFATRHDGYSYNVDTANKFLSSLKKSIALKKLSRWIIWNRGNNCYIFTPSSPIKSNIIASKNFRVKILANKKYFHVLFKVSVFGSCSDLIVYIFKNLKQSRRPVNVILAFSLLCTTFNFTKLHFYRFVNSRLMHITNLIPTTGGMDFYFKYR